MNVQEFVIQLTFLSIAISILTWLTFLLCIHRDFPGIRIGPEPTTDRFIAVMYDDKEGVIPGNALVVDPKKQFRPLSKYGNAVSRSEMFIEQT